MAANKTCPHCGAQIASQAVMCPHCKKTLAGLKKQGPKFKELPVLSKVMIIGVPLLVIFIIIGIASAGKEKKVDEPEASASPASAEPASDEPAQPESAAPAPASQPAPPPAPATPVDNIREAASSVVGDRLKDVAFDAPSGNAVVNFNIADNLTTGMMVDGAREDSAEIAKALCAAQPEVKQVLMGVWGDAEDAYGNTANEQVIKITLTRATAEKINISGMDWEKFPSIADYYKELVRF